MCYLVVSKSIRVFLIVVRRQTTDWGEIDLSETFSEFSAIRRRDKNVRNIIKLVCTLDSIRERHFREYLFCQTRISYSSSLSAAASIFYRMQNGDVAKCSFFCKCEKNVTGIISSGRFAVKITCSSLLFSNINKYFCHGSSGLKTPSHARFYVVTVVGIISQSVFFKEWCTSLLCCCCSILFHLRRPTIEACAQLA